MTQAEIAVKLIFDRWNASLKRFDELLGSLTDENLEKEIAPGKNRGVYLLGHMIAVHDDLLVLLDLGEKEFPELQEPFLKNADKVVAQIPTVAELRSMWVKQCESLQHKFAKLSQDDWFGRHMSVSAEDFAKEPHRNKLNIIVTRTSHLQYHLGQLQLLK